MIETKDLFAKSDLIPVIIQDRATKDILMLGYTNQEAYQKTLERPTPPGSGAGAVKSCGTKGRPAVISSM